MGQLVRNVERGRLQGDKLKDLETLTLSMRDGANPQKISAEDWGKAKPGNKP
jgi:hypothetical protein